jgi:hypothetical protein
MPSGNQAPGPDTTPCKWETLVLFEKAISIVSSTFYTLPVVMTPAAKFQDVMSYCG